jgi:hypothetical protein
MLDEPKPTNLNNPIGQLQWRRNIASGRAELFVALPGEFSLRKYSQIRGHAPDCGGVSAGFPAFQAWLRMGFDVLPMRDCDKV